MQNASFLNQIIYSLLKHPLCPSEKSGSKKWRKWKTSVWQQFHPSSMINMLGWILSCAEFGLCEAEQSQREQWHRATFPALWCWASWGRAGCLCALQLPRRCFQLATCNEVGLLTQAATQPHFGGILALLSTPQPSLWPYHLSAGILTASL